MAIDQRIILVSPLRVLARLTELVPTLDFGAPSGIPLVRITAGFPAGSSSRDPAGRTVRPVPPGGGATGAGPPGHQVHSGGLLHHSGADPVFLQESGGADLLPDRPAGPLYQLLGGIRAANPQLLEMARVFRVPALRGIRYVYLPQVLPYFRSACGSAPWDCAGRRASRPRSLACQTAPSANSSSRPRST